MSYVTYRKSFYRNGFRPLTNPYAATQLGLTPFEPEVLRPRGLGQNRAFTHAGGYGLHGLGDIVPNQSTVTWVGQISGTASISIQDVVSQATAALQADGLTVVSSSGLPFAIFDTDISLSSAAQVTLKILVNNGQGYSDPSDIASVVNHEIYVASGIMPTGSVTTVQPYGGTASLTPAAAASTTNLANWLEQNAIYIGLSIMGIMMMKEYL